MNKSESKYFNTAILMDEAFLEILSKKDFEYITVKEICEKAGVNRSTFYLHYETIDDLVYECNEYIISKFTKSSSERLNQKDIESLPTSELHFITPKYLMPWLDFICKNKKLFKTYINKFSTLTGEKNNKLLFQNVLNPILERFNVDEVTRAYMLKFYVEGVMAIVKFWVENDCREDKERICDIIIGCVYCETN